MIITLTAGLLMVYFWPRIAATFRKVILPAIRASIGETVAGALCIILDWIDTGMCAVRSPIIKAVGLFRKNVLGTKTTYHDLGAIVKEETEIFLLHPTEEGKGLRVIRTEEKPYETIPREARAAMNREGRQSVTLDTKAGLETKISEKARKQGLSEVLTMMA